MKKLLLIFFLISLTFFTLPEDVKIVKLPGEVAVTRDAFKETFVRNLCEDEELYTVMSIAALDEHIYVLSWKPVGIYKLDLQGKTIARAGRDGRGPGEFHTGFALNTFKNNLVFLDLRNKILLYNRDLKLIKEIKFPKLSFCFAVNKKENFVFPFRNRSKIARYFGVYSEEGKLLRSFGEKKTGYKPGKSSYDYVFALTYDAEKDGIWAAFGDRYDLSYYEKEKLKVEIKEKKDFFKEYKTRDRETGQMVTSVSGRPIKLAVVKKRVYFFYIKESEFYCDIFNKESYKLLRRIRLERYYRWMAHYKDGIFFGLYFGFKGEEDFQLYRLELE